MVAGIGMTTARAQCMYACTGPTSNSPPTNRRQEEVPYGVLGKIIKMVEKITKGQGENTKVKLPQRHLFLVYKLKKFTGKNLENV